MIQLQLIQLTFEEEFHQVLQDRIREEIDEEIINEIMAFAEMFARQTNISQLCLDFGECYTISDITDELVRKASSRA